MRYARIENELVVEIIINDNINNCYHPDFVKTLIECGKSVTAGMEYKDGVFTIAKPAEPAIEQQRTMMVMSNAQARLKLIKLGLFDAIDKTILSMPRNAPLYVLWEYGTNFYRTDEHLTAFCIDTLKMTAKDIDALFM